MSNAQENSVKLRDIHYLCPQTVWHIRPEQPLSHLLVEL